MAFWLFRFFSELMFLVRFLRCEDSEELQISLFCDFHALGLWVLLSHVKCPLPTGPFTLVDFPYPEVTALFTIENHLFAGVTAPPCSQSLS